MVCREPYALMDGQVDLDSVKQFCLREIAQTYDGQDQSGLQKC